MFITFEGIEGCGKSTQIKLLAKALEQAGFRVLLTREPGGCMISDKIRALLLDADNRSMVDMTELMLYAGARAQHVSEVIRPALADGAVVLCDRFSDATRAYQSFARGIDRHSMETLNDMACEGVHPFLTILIDCEVETGLGRARQRIELATGPREERFELESIDFHKKVRNGYLQLAAEEPERFLIIDGSDNIDSVFNKISAAVIPRLRALC